MKVDFAIWCLKHVYPNDFGSVNMFTYFCMSDHFLKAYHHMYMNTRDTDYPLVLHNGERPIGPKQVSINVGIKSGETIDYGMLGGN